MQGQSVLLCLILNILGDSSYRICHTASYRATFVIELVQNIGSEGLKAVLKQAHYKRFKYPFATVIE